jgi:hypothetical protein
LHSLFISTEFERVEAGSSAFRGLIGLEAEAATGAMNKYADQVTVVMIPDQACRRTSAHIYDRSLACRG